MKKVVRTSLNNVANKRGVRDLNIQLYSHDKNNAGFEFVIKNEVDLSEYKAKVLFDFQESFATWETKGTIEGNVVKVKFDTTFITKCEEVIGYLFLDSETDTLDVFKFKFNVVLSEIDKYDTTKRGFRYIKDQEVVDVITRSELEEELKKLQINGGIDLSGYLTTSVANETFATKQELGSYATKDELPSVSDLVTTEQLTAAKNSLVEEISNKGYVTSTIAEETYAKKSDLPTPYNDSALVQKIGQLEARVDKDTVYDDASLKQRVEALETKVDKDTVYNDEEVKRRLTELENKPAIDTSHFITDETLDSKNYLTTTVAEETYAKKSEIPQAYNDSALVERVTTLENRPSTGGGNVDTSNFVTTKMYEEGLKEINESFSNIQHPLYVGYVNQETAKEYLDSIPNLFGKPVFPPHAGGVLAKMNGNYPQNVQIFKGDENNSQFVDFDAAMYSLANSLPTGYSIESVSQDINNKVLFLSNKNFSEVVPKEELKSIVREMVGTGSTIDTSHFITEEILESKGFLTTHQDISNLATREELDKRVTREELEEKHYVTNEQISSAYATKSEIPQPYSDTELVKRITVLENKQDNDTVYDDAELKRRVTALEEKPNVDTSNFVTTSILESKGFLTQHQDLSEYAKKSELYNDTPLRTLVDNLEHDVLNGDSKVKLLENRVWELENKLREHDGIDLVYATKNELTNKENEFNFKFVLKDDLRRLVSEIVTELKSENN